MTLFNITLNEPIRKCGRKPFCEVLGPYSQMRHSSTCLWHDLKFLKMYASNDKI